MEPAADYTVIDNFLPKAIHENMYQLISHKEFPWYFHADAAGLGNARLGQSQLVHVFLFNGVMASDRSDVFGPLAQAISPLTYLRIKANLIPYHASPIVHQFHTDYDDPRITTAIYYVNTTNGHTVFADGSKVESIANRLLVFRANQSHAGTTCSDSAARYVMNLNYIAP